MNAERFMGTPIRTYRFLGIDFFSGSVDAAAGIVARWLARGRGAYVCVTGIHGLEESSRSVMVLRAHTEADLVVPDGMPAVLAGRIMGYRRTNRIYGPDLFLSLCRRAARSHWNVFLYGTQPRTLRALQKNLEARFPGIRISGSHAPPYRPLTRSERLAVARKIRRARAAIVFVGLSTPKQELWMHDMKRLLPGVVCIGVGAAFDFIAGTKRQAPRWIQQSGFEWLYRLIQEPQRLGRRTFFNVRFLYLACWNALRINIIRRNVRE